MQHTLFGRGISLLFAIVLPLIGANATLAQTASAVAEPDGYRLEDYRKPVPATLKGARGVLSADDAKALRDKGVPFLDVYPQAPKPPNLPAATVWREPRHPSIDGAFWLPNVGYGVISNDVRVYFESHLAELTENDKSRPMVFFCLRDCWMSWNAAKRAIELGYSSVYWFPEGTDAWEEHGYPVTIVAPAP